MAFLPGLGTQHVWSRDEARPALVAKEMLATGEWAVPHIGGRVYPAKPPLFPWVVALLSPNGVSESSLRLPSAIAAAGTVALTYALGARLVAPGAGIVAAAALASSFTFFQWARTGRMEMLLTLWITLGCWSLLRWLAAGRRADAALLGLWMGLGLLTKGPSAFVPALIAVVVLAAARARPRGLGGALALCALSAGAVLGLWLGLAWLTSPGFPAYIGELGPKFVSELGEHRTRNPLLLVAAGFLPWTLWLPSIAMLLVRSWRQAAGRLLLPLAWLSVVLVAFSTVVYPREAYFLPLYPPLAILLGWAWHTAAAHGRWMLSTPLAIAGLCVVALVTGLRLLGPLQVGHVPLGPSPEMTVTALVAVVSVVAGVALLRARRPVASAATVAVASLAIFVIVATRIHTPVLNLKYPVKQAAARLAARLPRDAVVAYVDRHHATALVFYLPHRSIRLPALDAAESLNGRRDVFLLLSEGDEVTGEAARSLNVVPIDTVRFQGRGYVLASLRGSPRTAPPR